MDHIAEKIKKILSSAYGRISGPPERYWNGFLLFVLILFLLMIGFDVFVYQSVTRIVSFDRLLLEPVKKSKVNEEALENILSTLSSRKAEFEKILEGPAIQDPSQ